MTTSTTSGLAARLREATSAEHRDTESRAFVTRLMEGELDLAAYTRYLAQYAHIYRALEDRTPRPDDPTFLVDPALLRFQAIESDLAALGAADWESEHPALPATAAYVARITAVFDDLPRFAGHHYTRYLGDLSGGQAIAKRVADHYDASEDQLGFYRFDLGEPIGRYKVRYRAGLDALDLEPGDEQALIDEAKRAFHHNAEVFEALAGA